MKEVLHNHKQKNRALFTGLAAASMALVGCSGTGDYQTISWVVGVECPEDTTPNVTKVSEVGDLYPNSGTAQINFNCASEETPTQAPESITLISGNGTIVDNDQEPNSVGKITINALYEQGNGWDMQGDQDPAIDYSVGNPARINLDGVREVKEVSVG